MKLMLYLNNSLVLLPPRIKKLETNLCPETNLHLTILNLISNQRWIKRKAKKKTLDMAQRPNNWTLGLFYYNKEDKRIFPPKRMAWAGWTVNFINPISVAVLAIVLIIIIRSFFAQKNSYPILLLRYIIQR
jgi:hypothetical protein